MKYEEWREEMTDEDWEDMERQEHNAENIRLTKLYDAVGTFEPEWKGNVRFFLAKKMQDYAFIKGCKNERISFSAKRASVDDFAQNCGAL